MRARRRRQLTLIVLFAALAAGGTAALRAREVPAPGPSEANARSARAIRAQNKSPRPTRPPCQPAGTLHQRAAQVVVTGLPEVTEPSHPLVAEVLDLGVGGVLLTDDNVESRAQVTALVQDLRRRSRHPLIVATDEETGRVRTFERVLGSSPSARRLAKEQTATAVRQRARELGAALASMGIDLDLAPVVDLDAGPYSGIIGDRSFSDDPAVTSEYALAFAGGLTDGGVRASAKHFPGHGPTTGDDHTGRVTATLSMTDLTATHLKPFTAMIGAGIPVVMMSNIDYTALDRDLPASLSPAAYRLLRENGFRGVAITDSVGMAAVNKRWDMAVAAVKAITAGADAVLTTDGAFAKDMVHALVVAVQQGELKEERLNEAAARTLALAGGDPRALTCQTADVPKLTTTAGAG